MINSNSENKIVILRINCTIICKLLKSLALNQEARIKCKSLQDCRLRSLYLNEVRVTSRTSSTLRTLFIIHCDIYLFV